MDKRQFLSSAAVLGAVAAPAFARKPVSNQACAASPTLLTIAGDIKRHNRGALDPALDQLMKKQLVKFDEAYTFDFQSIASLPSVTIKPTLEYDGHPHTLSGPLLTDVLAHVGAPEAGDTKVLLRAIDGYVVMLTLDAVRANRFIVATQLDGKPMPLGGLGPLWAVYDADRIPELAAKALNERFVTCPWAVYQIQVIAA
ncbi:molybdopterin-dependent oxidoreductase [Paraburkholderia sp.]|uniref:molybdopterin-dependent oxidoreductase n=1 Tax=Paraburkholderia sp. TaxID=1926495 RepID=UPI00239D709D|nr:molybdopterin-dependent oxidoreductase [Paraburkholderia sp.]MDE1179973.1 molybdopterin-dependent oxidoreductase [Paraburkholderia sp.]